jgi:hypothetical protein
MSRYLYANSLQGFLADHRAGVIVEQLRRRYEELRGGETVGGSEVEA